MVTKTTNTIDDTLRIPVLSAGEKLFHYTSAEGLKGICEGEFWVTERGFLNDFTEFQIATGIFKEVLDKHMKNKQLCEQIKNKVVHEVDRLQDSGLKEGEVAYSGEYIISFCLDGDSPLMWSEYSDFTGYCLEFDFDKLCNSFSNARLFLHGMVIYDHDMQMQLMEEAIEHEFLNWPKGFEYLNSWEDFDELTDENMEDFYWLMAAVVSAYNMFFKLPCFEGEHEYRFVFSCIHDGGRCKPEEREKQYFRIKDGVLIPFVKEPLSSLDSLERVVVGAKNKSDIAVKGLQHFFRNMKMDVEVEKSHMPLRY